MREGESICGLGRFIINLLLGLLAFAASPSLRAGCEAPSVSTPSYYSGLGFSVEASVLCSSGNTATGYFEWGPSTSYGNTSPTFTILPNDASPQFFNYTLYFGEGPTTLMHFRAVAYNSIGTTYTGDQTFLSQGWAVITNQPQSQSVSVGTNVTFTVGLLSDPNLAPYYYQWYKNGTVISGATNSSLVLTNVQPSDGGTYGVQAENQFEGGSFWQYGGPAYLTVPAPDLAVKLSGTNIVLSWPAAANEYFLESSAVFGTNSWTSVSSPMQTNSSNIFVTLPVTGLQQFYRLHHY